MLGHIFYELIVSTFQADPAALNPLAHFLFARPTFSLMVGARR
jgi:hypothetical protein|tara:strand:+ start:232 stop:360 length:129 start_codon:yes stop_codon:yes gene_type:complete